MWIKTVGRYLTIANRFSGGPGIVGPSENPAKEYIDPAWIAVYIDWRIKPPGGL
jgi:hypothetical protein